MNKLQIKILDKRIGKTIPLPSRATDGSAGFDLHACIDEPLVLSPGDNLLIGTGIAMFIADPNVAGIILPRSGLGHKHGIVLGNLVGLIDSDYQGELRISCWNRSNVAYTISPGDRIAQLVLMPIFTPEIEIIEDFAETTRGDGGFGSTGTSTISTSSEDNNVDKEIQTITLYHVFFDTTKMLKNIGFDKNSLDNYIWFYNGHLYCPNTNKDHTWSFCWNGHLDWMFTVYYTNKDNIDMPLTIKHQDDPELICDDKEAEEFRQEMTNILRTRFNTIHECITDIFENKETRLELDMARIQKDETIFWLDKLSVLEPMLDSEVWNYRGRITH